MVEEVYRNIADGYHGLITLPGGATINIGLSIYSSKISVKPEFPLRQKRGGIYEPMSGIFLRAPLGVPHNSTLNADETKYVEIRAIKKVINRAQESKSEFDARRAYRDIQEAPVDLTSWKPVEDADADAALIAELTAARIGFYWKREPHANTRPWTPGHNPGTDRRILWELQMYRKIEEPR